jgi:hypothetical protein
MNEETVSNQEEPSSENDSEALDPEVLDRIKHPPAIDDTMRELDPEERIENPAVAPQMLDESRDLRDDLHQ